MMPTTTATYPGSVTARAYAHPRPATATPTPSIAFFGHDAGESTVIKRATAFQACGARVVGFMFRRERAAPQRPLPFENVDLGVTADRNYARRVPKLLAGVARTLKRRDLLETCNVFYARNLDMLLVAEAARRLGHVDAALVYECLDVRRVFLGNGSISKAFRWSERKLLGASDLLVVSAPDYLTRYFGPVQGYVGPTYLLENKPLPHMLPARPERLRCEAPPRLPWVIGWFGVLRCTRTLDILCGLARALPKRVQVYIRGIPSETDIPLAQLDAVCRRLPNVVYDGPYANPDDLPDIYGRVHFVWASDFQDAGGNSDWCLTNRLYEGGLCGTVMLSARDNATGRFVERHRLGFALPDPLDETLPAFLQGLDAEAYLRARSRARSAPMSLFVDGHDTARLVHLMRTLRRRDRVESS